MVLTSNDPGDQMMDELARGRQVPTPVTMTVELIPAPNEELRLMAALASVLQSHTFKDAPPHVKVRATRWLATQYEEAP